MFAEVDAIGLTAVSDGEKPMTELSSDGYDDPPAAGGPCFCRGGVASGSFPMRIQELSARTLRTIGLP